MEKKSVILGFILAIVLFGLIALASAEDWNLNNPVVVQNQNVTGKQNLTFLPENAIVIIGAGGNVTSDAVNLTYYTANQTLVVKLIKVQNISDSDNSAYYIDPASTGVSGVFAGDVVFGGSSLVSPNARSRTYDFGVGGNTELVIGHSAASNYSLFTAGSAPASQLIIAQNSTTIMTYGYNGDVGVGTGTYPTGGGTPVFVMAQAGSAPTGFGSNTAGFYVLDLTGTARPYAIDEAGTSTKLTTGNDTLLAQSNLSMPYFVNFFNPYLGKSVEYDVGQALADFELITKKKYIYIENMDTLSWEQNEDRREQEENNRSKNTIAEAWLRNNSEIEVSASTAFETLTDTKIVTTGKVIGNTTEYVLDEVNETITPIQVPIYETKTISHTKKKIKDSVRFDKKSGKFYQKRTKEEALIAVGESYPHYIKQAPPKWMQDRGAN